MYIKDKGVINVTPFVVCGNPCQPHYIVKNTTSSIDVTYQDSTGATITTVNLDNIGYDDLPDISVLSENYTLDFENLISCTTPLGNPFKTIVDICLDHNTGIGMHNIANLSIKDKDVLSQPVSHIVLSNTTSLQHANSVGNVMHNDPIDIKKYPQNIEKTISFQVGFGKSKIDIYAFKMKRGQILLDSLVARKQSIEAFYTSLPKTDLNFQKYNRQIITLEELKVADDDIYMENFILEIKEMVYLNDRSISLVEKLANLLQDSEKHQQIVYHYKLLSDYKSFLYAGYEDPLQEIGKLIIKTTLEYRKLEKYSDKFNQYLLSIANGTDFNKIRDYFDEKIYELEGLSLDINKEEMQKFISLERAKFASPSSEYARFEQLRYIENTIKKYVQNKPIITKIQAISEEYRDNATAFTIGMKRKAMKIENALKSMTIEECCNFLDTNQPSHPVLQALASHRLSDKVYLKNDTVDERKAVSKYKEFSKQIKGITDSYDGEHSKGPNKI